MVEKTMNNSILTRYDLESFMSCGGMDTVMEKNVEGDWVKWEDVVVLLSQSQNPSPLSNLGGSELCILCGQTHCDVCPLPASNVTVAVNREVLRDIAQLLSGSMFTYISTEEQARARGSELYGLLAAKDSPQAQMGPKKAVLQAVIDEMMLQRASANNIRQQARNVIAAYVKAGGYGKPRILQVAVKPLDISEASDV